MDPQSLQFLGLPALLWIPLLPLLGATINLVLGRYFSKWMVNLVAVGSVGLAFALAATLVFGGLFYHPPDPGHAGQVLEALWKTGGYSQTAWSWMEVGSFKAELAFHLDSLSAVMILIVTFVGSLIHIYSIGYMAADKG